MIGWLLQLYMKEEMWDWTLAGDTCRLCEESSEVHYTWQSWEEGQPRTKQGSNSKSTSNDSSKIFHFFSFSKSLTSIICLFCVSQVPCDCLQGLCKGCIWWYVYFDIGNWHQKSSLISFNLINGVNTSIIPNECVN